MLDLLPAFRASLCPTDFGFTDDGYLSPCTTNTYLYSPIAIVLVLWALAEMRSLRTDSHASNTLAGQIKFALSGLYTVVLFLHGAKTFNVISQLVSLITNAVVFILSFCDLKGVRVPQKPLEVYFFLVAAVTGYFVVHAIGTQDYSARLLGSVYLCLVASLAGSARNIISAFEDAQIAAEKNTK